MAQLATDPGVAGWLRRTRESRLGTMVVLAVTALVVSVAAYAMDRSHAVGSSGITAVNLTGNAGPAPVVGKPAPGFTATTTDGTPLSLQSLHGHPVWLTFGASWCAACRAEAADIEATYQKVKPSGAVVVEVFISEDAGAVKGYGQRVGLTYPKIADPNTDISSEYRVLGIPAHFFIDANGVLRSVKEGSLTPEQMSAAIAGASR